MPVTGITYESQISLDSGNTAPHGSAWIPSLSRVWVASNNDDYRYIYDELGAYQSKVALPNGNTQPRGFCYVESRDEVWSLDSSLVYRIGVNGSSLGTYNLHQNNRHGEGILYFEDVDEVWICDRVDRLWYRMDASDGSFLGTYHLNHANSDPRAAAYVDGQGWCLNGADKKIYPYSSTGVYSGTAIDISASHSLPRALTRVRNKLWILENSNDSIF